MGRQQLAIIALLPLSAICRDAVTNLTSIPQPDHFLTKTPPAAVLAATGDPTSDQAYWQECACRGMKLTKACMLDKDKALEFGTPLDTRFDGTLEAELASWGYVERNKEANQKHCELFDMTLESVMEGLGFEGHNECFWFQHNRGEKEPFPGESAENWVPVEQQTYKVGEKTYRNTYAKAVMAANADDGVIFFIDRRSAVSGAAAAWGVRVPPADQLPELRQMSDLAWGIWCRVHPDRVGLNNINYFVVAQIVNKETQGLIMEALNAGQDRDDAVPEWPGVTWDIESQQGAAMFGSANGIAIGYFLSQHKAQLSGNKYVYQVQVYVENEGGFPYMVFYVKDALEQALKRSEYGKGMVSGEKPEIKL